MRQLIWGKSLNFSWFSPCIIATICLLKLFQFSCIKQQNNLLFNWIVSNILINLHSAIKIETPYLSSSVNIFLSLSISLRITSSFIEVAKFSPEKQIYW